MKILNSTIEDMPAIFKLYDAAIAYQQTKFHKHWQGFDVLLIEKEIEEHRQYKMIDDGIIVCIFAVAFNDALIWGNRDKDPSIYIHRIVTNPLYRGRGYVKNIIEWAVKFGSNSGKKFVRMDTWGDNEKLIKYYTSCGFNFLGLSHTIADDALPKHYQGIQLSLFQIAIWFLAVKQFNE